MTAQIPDRVMYNGERYDLIGIKGSELFYPEAYGLKLIMAGTACYNGYILTFKCDNDEFILDELLIRTQEEPVEINNIRAEKYEGNWAPMFSHHYSNLQLKRNFTGEIIIAREFIEEMYVHMGYQSPRAFRQVYRLKIIEDKIMEVIDLSKTMEEKRREDPFKDSTPTNPEDGKSIRAWVDKKFSRDIDEE
ncbi:MAG: hypothetical protein ACFFDW_03730 [Candidatus Thorarchaeota archaeon]